MSENETTDEHDSKLNEKQKGQPGISEWITLKQIGESIERDARSLD